MDVNSPVLKNIENGYKFFTDWLDQILEKGMIGLYLAIV